MKPFALEDILRQFWESGQEKPVVIYDVDDTLWSLMHVVCKRLEIDFERATAVFSIRDNPDLTPDEQDRIIAAFADESYFEEMEFFPGAEEILAVCELGAEVGLNTHSFTQPIADWKIPQLLDHITGLKREQIQSNIIDHSQARQKVLDPRTTILAEDSPHNVAMSQALVNLMPLNIGWTYSPTSKILMRDKCVVYRPDLREMNDFIYELVRLMMRG